MREPGAYRSHEEPLCRRLGRGVLIPPDSRSADETPSR
ncbi:hypothetical protein MBEHAL_0874 [Halarchaeum acidiphilum MH1-52-1]|uniref:Uncharacterized protein n=1 Tax=Halarchaeum acidiphilum MH1-52-1 TaxID=1261545 RepID=U3A386_9EURY|nr:hypothetical protein MBEHAL_0874 [Halarchaeum acidiphilum MH1-52-1]